MAIHNAKVVKTIRYRRITYVGDPLNTIKIFNELEVDELMVLDIRASKSNSEPDYELLAQLASESFMPLSYGGGINSIDKAEKILRIGYEKIILNTYAYLNHKLVTDLVETFGSQAVVVSVDYRIGYRNRNRIYVKSGYKKLNLEPAQWARKAVELGAGEIVFSCISNEGTWKGLDIKSLLDLTNELPVPVVLHGGARDLNDLIKAFKLMHVSGIAIGNLALYQGPKKGILINIPKLELGEK